MKVALTGGSGHIGSCLIRELIKRGDEVKVLVHNYSNYPDSHKVRYVKGSLQDPVSLKKLCEGADVVFHLAAFIALDNRNAKRVYDTNITGTANILEAAKVSNVGRFIHFSSIDAFQSGRDNEVFDETRSLVENRKSNYKFSKAESERLVMNAVKDGLDSVIISPTAVIGPYDFRGSFLGKALIRLYKSKIPFLVKGGYNWVDVRDVTNAALLAIERGRRGEKYIVCGNYAGLRELAQMINKISGSRIPRYIPFSLALLVSPFMELYGSVTNTTPLYTKQSLRILAHSPKNVSCEKAQKELGYSPRKLQETLYDTYNWYLHNNFIN